MDYLNSRELCIKLPMKGNPLSYLNIFFYRIDVSFPFISLIHSLSSRNYHIFYQLCAGADDEEKRKYSIRIEIIQSVYLG